MTREHETWYPGRWARRIGWGSRPWRRSSCTPALLLLLLQLCGPTPVQAQEVVTRWAKLRAEAFEDFLRDEAGSPAEADAILRQVREHSGFDQITVVLRQAPPVALDIVNDFEFVHVRARGAVSDIASIGDRLRAYWLADLQPLAGEIALAVDPVQRSDGRPPVLRLSFRTLREYPCTSYGLVADLDRGEGGLHLEIHGVDSPGLFCSPVDRHARGAVEVPLPEGDHALTVRYDDSVDYHHIRVRDTWVRLVPGSTRFTLPDTVRRWLYPERSFALYCGAQRALLCDRLATWIGTRPGISAFTFGEDGVVPYRRQGAHHYYRYDGPAEFDPVRTCLDHVTRRTAPLGRYVWIEIEFWTGERHRPNGSHAEQSSCLASIPDSAAAGHRSVERRSAGEYRNAWASKMDWFHRVLTDSSGQPLPPRIDAVGGRVRAQAPFHMPPGPPPPVATGPVILPPNQYTDALTRAKFHEQLGEWLQRGGLTVGDVAAYTETAWLWVEDRFDWFFLLGETTAAAARAYFDLVERHGPAIPWRVDDEGADSPQRVHFGPDRVVIPDFRLYRWRDRR